MATWTGATTTSSGGNISMYIQGGYDTVTRNGNTVTFTYGIRFKNGGSSWTYNSIAAFPGGTRQYAFNSGSGASHTTSGTYYYAYTSGSTRTSAYSGFSYSGTVSGTGSGNITVSVSTGWDGWTPSKAYTYKFSVPYPAQASYTITYNANGGTGAPSNQTKYQGTSLTLSSTKPTRSNSTATGYTVTFNGNGGTPSKTSQAATNTTSYTFSKWNTKSDGSGTSYDAGASYTADAAATLYAQWSSSTTKGSITTATATRSNGSASRVVTINANGGSSTVTSRTSTATITYSCNGWYTATSGGTKRAASGGSYTPSATETVYAQWSSTTGSYSAVTLPTTSQCTRSGYKLLGFATSSTATTAAYSPGASYTPSAAVTLYAVWELEQAQLYTKKSGAWVKGPVYVKVNGSWVTAKQVYTKVNGSWVLNK